jgi:hypothetical protein
MGLDPALRDRNHPSATSGAIRLWALTVARDLLRRVVCCRGTQQSSDG